MELNDVFHPRKACRNSAIFGLIVFGSFLAMAVCLAVSDGSVMLGFLYGTFCSFLVLLSAWMLLKYYRESFTIRNGTIVHRGVRCRKSFDFSELVEVQWKRIGFGVIILRSQFDKVRISLEDFTPEQRTAIIRLIRMATPENVQRGWEQFCYVVAMPLLRRLGKYTPQKPDEFYLIGLPAWSMLGIVGVTWYLAIKQTLPYPAVWWWTGMILWLGILLLDVYVGNRRIRYPKQEAVERAVKDWERYEISQ